jgi:probable F420-dependent oxidoreductase
VSGNGIGGFGGRRLAEALGPLGVWSFALQRMSAATEMGVARQLEQLGYPAIWIPESLGSKEAIAHSALLLQATHRAIVAPGIANIHARDPMAMANGARTLGEAHPGRFVLGVGVSHAPSVTERGGTYANPLAQMRTYLEAMDAAEYAAPAPDPPVPLVLAALGPRMLALAAEKADGAHPYFVPVEHTRFAREQLGAQACLVTEVTAVLSTDRSAGLAVARAFARHYLELPNYANNLRRLGWGEADLGGEGSERLIDAVVAIGDADAIVGRVRDHLQAGADHVCLQIRAESSRELSLDAYRQVAAAFGLEPPGGEVA